VRVTTLTAICTIYNKYVVFTLQAVCWRHQCVRHAAVLLLRLITRRRSSYYRPAQTCVDQRPSNYLSKVRGVADRPDGPLTRAVLDTLPVYIYMLFSTEQFAFETHFIFISATEILVGILNASWTCFK